MTADTLLTYSRCPLVIDEASGRRCNHPGTRTWPGKDVMIMDTEEMKHTIECMDDLGHSWYVCWETTLYFT